MGGWIMDGMFGLGFVSAPLPPCIGATTCPLRGPLSSALLEIAGPIEPRSRSSRPVSALSLLGLGRRSPRVTI